VNGSAVPASAAPATAAAAAAAAVAADGQTAAIDGDVNIAPIVVKAVDDRVAAAAAAAELERAIRLRELKEKHDRELASRMTEERRAAEAKAAKEKEEEIRRQQKTKQLFTGLLGDKPPVRYMCYIVLHSPLLSLTLLCPPSVCVCCRRAHSMIQTITNRIRSRYAHVSFCSLSIKYIYTATLWYV
jgi:hypothetical protein